jgi:hypothetical protein
MTAGTGRVMVTGNAGVEVEALARRVVRWAAANPGDVPTPRLGDRMALFENVDCHFIFEEVDLIRHGGLYGLAMAAALYCALTGATAKEGVALVGGAGREGVLMPAQKASIKDVEGFAPLQDFYDTIVMEKDTAKLFKDALSKHGSVNLRSRPPTLIGVTTYLEGIMAGVDAPVGRQSRLVVVPPPAPGP